jgi:hypothetical protein
MGGAGLGNFACLVAAGAANDGAVGGAVAGLGNGPVFGFEAVHQREGLVMCDKGKVQ